MCLKISLQGVVGCFWSYNYLNSHTHMFGVGFEEGTNCLEKLKTWHMMPLELLSRMFVEQSKNKTQQTFLDCN